MKMLIAIVRDIDDDNVTQALTAVQLRVTKIASTGGFLRHGNVTLLLGLEDEQVETALNIIHETCAPSPDTQTRRATIFVLNVMSHQKF